MLSSRKDNFYFCTLNNLLALSEFGCSAKFLSMKTCTLVITCIICPTGFAITYLWKMSLFAKDTMSGAFSKRPKRHKIHPKEKQRGEGKEGKIPNVFLLSTFSTRKKPKHVKMVKLGQFFADIFLKIQLDVFCLNLCISI